jgi:hypothetical protein
MATHPFSEKSAVVLIEGWRGHILQGSAAIYQSLYFVPSRPVPSDLV